MKGEKVEKIHSLDFGGSQEREKFFIFHFRKRGGNFETKSALLSSGLWKGNKKHQSFYPSSPQPRSAKYKKCRLRDANFWATIFVSVDFTSAKVDSIRSLNFLRVVEICSLLHRRNKFWLISGRRRYCNCFADWNLRLFFSPRSHPFAHDNYF